MEMELSRKISFRVLKLPLLYLPALAMYGQSVPLKLDFDALQYWFGALLSHICQNKTEKSIPYESRTLIKKELNYSLMDKDGVSIIFSQKKFSQYLLRNRFVLITNNKTTKK